jgi:hypothetical protein
MRTGLRTHRRRHVLGLHWQALCPLALLALLLTNCSRPDERSRSRVRGNLQKIEAFISEEMSRLNTGSRVEPSGLRLPAEVGRHAKGAFLTPIPPRDSLEKLLTLSDGLVHEQYDVLADPLGFDRPVTCFHGECPRIWTPKWMEIRGFALSGPQKTLECMSLRVVWKGRDVASPKTNERVFPIRKVTSESFCPSSSWQGEPAL